MAEENIFVQLLVEDEHEQRYELFVSKEDYARAQRDIVFASELLRLHKEAVANQLQNTLSTDIAAEDDPDCLDLMDNENELCSPAKGNNNCVCVWTKPQTMLLLTLYQEYEPSLANGMITNRKFWSFILSGLKKEGHKFTLNQCKNKIDRLKRSYKDIIDHNRQSGNDPKTCEFYDILHEIFIKKPWITPLSTAGSNIPLEGLDDQQQPSSCKRRKLEIEEAQLTYLKECSEDKRLKREATERYRQNKLDTLKQLLDVIKPTNK